MSTHKDHADRRQAQRCWATTGRPAWLRGLAIMLLLMGWTASPCWGQEANPQALVRQIVAAWQQRQRVRTLRCRVQVDSFYPRGYLSTLDFHLLKSPPLPPKDCRFTDGFCFWAVELSGAKVKKIRKEHAWMKPFLDQKKGKAEFIQRHTLFLYTDGQCRRFWPVPNQEVTLLGSSNTMGMVSGLDLPLAWVLGRVNGEVFCVGQWERSEPAERFTYRGQAEYKGQKCAVLTLPEQNTQTLFREFWVGLGPGYPIYYCRSQEGDRVYSEIEVEYSSEGQGEVPRRWTCYDHEEGLIAYDTCTVQEWQVNVSLPDELFVRDYQPGETVYDMPRRQKFRVDAQGQLVPLTPVVSEPRSWLRILLPAWLILILILLVWYGVRRLLRHAIKN